MPGCVCARAGVCALPALHSQPLLASNSAAAGGKAPAGRGDCRAANHGRGGSPRPLQQAPHTHTPPRALPTALATSLTPPLHPSHPPPRTPPTTHLVHLSGSPPTESPLLPNDTRTAHTSLELPQPLQLFFTWGGDPRAGAHRQVAVRRVKPTQLGTMPDFSFKTSEHKVPGSAPHTPLSSLYLASATHGATGNMLPSLFFLQKLRAREVVGSRIRPGLRVPHAALTMSPPCHRLSCAGTYRAPSSQSNHQTGVCRKITGSKTPGHSP